jgi:peptide-methionine (R)-S-oxide reductase
MVKRVEKPESEWKAQLSPAEYKVIRQKGTEAPFTGEYVHSKEAGVYRCRACGAPLFSSETKYDSGSGWPSFYEPLKDENVEEKDDRSLFMHRTEVLCAACDAHLGHVFPDGPDPTGLRYCINSCSLELDKDMDPDQAAEE